MFFVAYAIKMEHIKFNLTLLHLQQKIIHPGDTPGMDLICFTACILITL